MKTHKMLCAYFLLSVIVLYLKAETILENGRSERSVNYKFNDTEPKDITEFYCDKSGPMKIDQHTEGKIITRYQGRSSYNNNQFCQWDLDAGDGYRIQILVEQWQLQFAPTRAICAGYDHITVKDYHDVHISWCQSLPIFETPFYINSQSQRLSVVFQSDQSNPRNQEYKGGILRFKTFNASGCPPNWINYKNSCFTLKSVAQTWSDSQKTCNMEQSNLANIISQEEFSSLQLSYMGFQGKVWIGLNDKSVFGTFKWIDNTSAAGAFDAMNSLKLDPFNHCGLVDFRSGTVVMADCEMKAAVLCRTEMGTISKIYAIPTFKTDKGSEEDSKRGRGVLLGVLIPCVIVLLGIIAAVCIYRKREKFSCIKTSEPSTKRSEEQFQPIPLAPSAPQQPSSSQHIAPPTYEEALLSDRVL